MEKILVTQALNELKLLDARINRAINDAVFVTAAKSCETKVNPSKSKDEFNKDAKSAFESIKALIKRRELIKSAIVDSNAKTEVEICGVKMSVAKAIDTKNSICYHRSLLNSMKYQRDNANMTMNRNNSNMESKIDSLVATAFGKESKTNVKPEDYDAIAKPFRASNEYSLVDPIGINDAINEEENFIEQFEATVDQILQVSNCTNFIEI